jgi:hypothetical protein
MEGIARRVIGRYRGRVESKKMCDDGLKRDGSVERLD